MPEKVVVLRNCGKIDPWDIFGYLDSGGFQGLKRAREEMSSTEALSEIKASGLRGRGGAGFPCGVKWETAASFQSPDKYLICNADEGEVGAFKDRFLIQNDPFSLIEGILIACYAIDARKAFIYLREEYTFLADIIRSALEQTSKEGLSEGIEIKLVLGAGAYVCGEESALIESIEGKRGEPRCRPPFPTQKGLFGRPTVINNVETLMNVPWILTRGAGEFKRIGTEGNSGTKVFSVSGDVDRPGIYELALGSSLKELVFDHAGATDVKVVQVGGAAGRIIPFEELDIPLTYETALGSGAVVVMNHARDIIDIIACTLDFFREESCGKCAPCREGTRILAETLKRISDGEGTPGDIDVLDEISQVMQEISFCGLGQAAPVPLLDSLKFFRSAYHHRVEQANYLRSLEGYLGGSVKNGQ